MTVPAPVEHLRATRAHTARAGVRLTRRRLLGLFALGGGSLALAACGGASNTPNANSVPSAAPSSTPSPTAPPATVARAATSVAIPATVPAAASASARATGGATASATPGTAAIGTPRPAASGTPAGAAGDAPLVRLLRQVPQRGVVLNRQGLSFGDLEMQKRNYGLEGLTSYAAFAALTREQISRFNQALAGVQTPSEISFQVAAGDKPSPLGYTIWQVERAAFAGQTPTGWLRLEGRLDTAAIRAALTGARRTTAPYGGATILTYGGDGDVNFDDPIGKLGIFGTFNRATLDDGALTAAPNTAAIEGSIDALAGRGPTLADDPDYLAVATALGPVVGATIVPPEGLFRPPAPSARGTATASPARPPTPGTGERLPAYRGAGMGLRDDGQTHTMVIALSYTSADEARTAAALVRRRAEEYQFTVGPQGQFLRARAVPGTPQFVTVGARTVVLLPLAIADMTNLGLWRQMLDVSDYRFLAE